MKKKIIALLVISAFLGVTAFSTSFVMADTQSEPLFDIEPLYDTKYAESLTVDREFAPPNSPWYYPTIDDYTGVLVWRFFENIFNGTYGNIWISLDPLYDEYIDNGPVGYGPEDIWLFGYPWTPTGIPGYLPAGYRDVITGEDLIEILEEFDNNIHDTVVEYFGEYETDPAVRPGPFGDGTVQIMVFNLRDEFFYSPDTAPGFIVGYFWSSIADWGANAFHMDSYQWWRRQGTNPPMVDPFTGYDYAADGISVLPLQYEGTFAHEFQHLVNNDVDHDEFSWVDEGSSVLAEYLCGYGFSAGHIEEYLLWFWDTPITIWEGYLADYGASFLWTFYMYEHYGGLSLIWDMCHEQANGIEGWNNVLAARGVKKTFDDIFEDFCIALYLDDTSWAGGKYGFFALDIPSENSNGMSIPLAMELWDSWYPDTGYFDWFVNEYPYDGSYILAGRGLAYTVSYVKFTEAPFIFEVTFDGDDTCGAAPTSGTHNWYSDGAAWSWFTLSQTFDIPATGASLSFSNYFSIEEDWDYGYVEVYDDATGLWTTLPGLGTTDHLGYEQDNLNTPVEREPTTYNVTGNWNCFTGESGGIYTEVMDLSAFAGKTIELSFTYWTDAYTQASGWYVDDIEIPEIGFSDDCETEGDWVVNYGWYLNDEIIFNDFEVNFIITRTIFKKNGDPWVTHNFIDRMKLNDETEEGKEIMVVLNQKHITSDVVMVVANQPGYEHTFGTVYTFSAHKWKPCWRW